MTKHRHKFQYANRVKEIPTGKEIATFICECGAMKRVETKELK